MLKSTVIGLSLLPATFAAAGGVESWPFNVAINGPDVNWTSPTAVDPAADRYAVDFVVDTLEATVGLSGIELDVDLTGEVPPELLANGTIEQGPAPVSLPSVMLVYPEPPEPAAVAATLGVGIDANGFGTYDVTNVTLGSIEVDLGFPLGVQTVDILEIRIDGTVTVNPMYAGDVNDDGVVDFADVLQILTAWGMCPDDLSTCPADLNGDGVVGFGDVLETLTNWS